MLARPAKDSIVFHAKTTPFLDTLGETFCYEDNITGLARRRPPRRGEAMQCEGFLWFGLVLVEVLIDLVRVCNSIRALKSSQGVLLYYL